MDSSGTPLFLRHVEEWHLFIIWCQAVFLTIVFKFQDVKKSWVGFNEIMSKPSIISPEQKISQIFGVAGGVFGDLLAYLFALFFSYFIMIILIFGF